MPSLRNSLRARSPGTLVTCLLALQPSASHAQSIEPRLYSNAPVGVNFLIMGYAYTRGALATNASLPLTHSKLTTSSAVFGYARVLDFWGKSGKFDAIVPYSWLSGSAEYAGEPVERDIAGRPDPALRLSVNLYGAPALTLDEFKHYKQDLIVGASLQVTPPWGQYDHTRLVNLGSNRWSFNPELGISKAIGPLTLELAGAATLYTDNRDFMSGHSRSQEPLYSSRGHMIYAFRSGVWASLDAIHFTGGRSTLDGQVKDDLQRNWRLGLTLALPVDVHNSVKLFASRGVAARTGNNFDLIGIAWQYRWGGGL